MAPTAMNNEKPASRPFSRDPKGSAFAVVCLLAAGALLAALALAGCSSSGKYFTLREAQPSTDARMPAACAPLTRWPVTTQPGATGQPTTRPDAAIARGQLDRAILLVTRLDYGNARVTLANIEGRLLLARDLQRAPEAAFWLAFCDEKLGQFDHACREYQRVLERYPETPQADTASDRLSRLRPIRARPAIE